MSRREPKLYQIILLDQIVHRNLVGADVTKREIMSKRRNRAIVRVRDRIIGEARALQIPAEVVAGYLNRDHSTIVDADKRQRQRAGNHCQNGNPVEAAE